MLQRQAYSGLSPGVQWLKRGTVRPCQRAQTRSAARQRKWALNTKPPTLKAAKKNTAALRQSPKRSEQRFATSPLPHRRGQLPLNKSRRLCPRTQRTTRRRDRRRGWTKTLLARDELDGWPGLRPLRRGRGRRK